MAIPGIDVTERPWAGSADARAFARDPGPGNPNVGRETLRAPASAAAPAAPPPPNGGGLRSAWDAFTGNTKNMVGPQPQAGRLARAGQAAARGIRTAGIAALKGTGALGAAAGVGAEAMDVARVARDDNSTGIDVATQVAEGAGKLGTAALGAKAGALAGAFGGPLAPVTVPLGAAAGGLAGYYGGEKLIEGARSMFGSSPDSPAEQISLRQAAAGAGAGRGFVNPPNVVPAPASTMPSTSVPGAPSGAPENQVAPGIYQHGRGQYSDNPNGMGMPAGFTGHPNAQNMAAADNLAARESLRGAAGASFPGRPSMPVPGNSSNSWQARNDLRNLRVGASSITNDKRWGGEGSKSPDVQAYLAAQNADTALRGGMDPGSVARTNAAASMYASDNSLRGATASAGASRASAEARLRYDMNKDARDFSLRAEETGLKRRDSDRAARASEQEAVNKRLETMFRTNVDGKDVADTRKIGEYTRALQATLGSHIERLKATGTPEALAKAAELSARGPAALDDQDHAQLKQLFDRREVSRSSKGVLPWAGTHTESDDLFNYEQNSASPYDNGLLQTQVRTRGGSSIPLNDLRGKNWYGGGTENIDQTKRLRLPQ